MMYQIPKIQCPEKHKLQDEKQDNLKFLKNNKRKKYIFIMQSGVHYKQKTDLYL